MGSGSTCPFLVLKVRRGPYLLSDTLLQINGAKNDGSLKKPLKVGVGWVCWVGGLVGVLLGGVWGVGWGIFLKWCRCQLTSSHLKLVMCMRCASPRLPSPLQQTPFHPTHTYDVQNTPPTHTPAYTRSSLLVRRVLTRAAPRRSFSSCW